MIIKTTAQNAWKSGHNYSNLAQSQMLIYKHEQLMVPDNWTKYYEQNNHILLWDIIILKIYEKLLKLFKFGTEPNFILHASAVHGT